jgi:hypothetical protein
MATCNRCETIGLDWKQDNGKWRLYNGSNTHQCPTELPPKVQRVVPPVPATVATRNFELNHAELGHYNEQQYPVLTLDKLIDTVE